MITDLAPDQVHQLSELFKSLSDPTRVRILHALASEERNVGELARELAVSQSALSHQLRLLRVQGVVTFRREGKNAYYRLLDTTVVELMNVGLGALSPDA